ncbi:MAG: DUF3108 domain-containing protein [Proteobacteria bacterium]|nr:DUF3108 domain-containing protein [Pseudomonadota bacterium]
MRTSILFLIGLSLASSAGAAPAQRVEIAYELSRNGSAIAELVEKLEHDGKSYRLSALMKGKGLMSLRGDAARTSRGSIAAEGLRPLEFEDKRTGRDTARAKFDWQAKTLTLQAKEGAAETKPLPPDIQDRLSFTYSFAFHAPGTAPVPLSITDGKGISTSVYEPAGRETLKTPAGEFETLKMTRRKNNPDDRSSEIWLAEKRGYLPVRILVVEKNGTRIDQVATRVTTQ